MKTWHFEIVIVSIILALVTYWLKNDIVNWLTTLAIIFTFNHAQIGDRLQEKQANMDKPTVECYHKLHKVFVIKEILWITAFIYMGNYAATAGSILFIMYPAWRRWYRSNIKSL
jgi:hypothetical protein